MYVHILTYYIIALHSVFFILRLSTFLTITVSMNSIVSIPWELEQIKQC